MADQNFYESLDLKYGEIGIAMAAIDRMNPGKIPFSIPVLTPSQSSSSVTSNKVIQRDKSKLTNADNSAVDVSNIDIGNAVYITVPKELCALPGAVYDITGTVNVNGSYTMSGSGNSSVDGTISVSGPISISGLSVSANSGSLSQPSYPSISSFSISSGSASGSGSISGSGSVSGSQTSDGSGTINIDGNIKGTVTEVLNDSNRYIATGSKWLIMFVGGDINMPRVIARLPD